MMIQTPDSSAASLNGPLAFVLLVTVVLVLPISFGLIWLYRRAVAKSMRARKSSGTSETNAFVPLPEPEISVDDASSLIPASTKEAALHTELVRAPWRAAAVYVVAGVVYALIMSAAFFASSEIELNAPRVISIFWVYLWPAVLSINLVAASTRRAKVVTLLAYFLIFGVMCVIVTLSNPEIVWGGPLLVWIIYDLPATLLLLTFLNRRVRSVGPLVLIFILLAVSGSELIVSILASSDEIARLLISLVAVIGLGARSLLLALLVLGFFIVWPVGWLILKLLRLLYERKKISDQSITLDSIWLLFGFVNSLMLSAQGTAWIYSGLLAFVGYKVVAWVGFRLLNPRTAQTTKPPKLLVLRVFSLGKRGEKLFGALATHWRHVGSIQLIAGPDLATSTLEPHEFLDFVSGKLARRFIDGVPALEKRLKEMDTKADQDGRFRVNDFFCYDDTWKMVLSSLVEKSNVVLMDLRGFTADNEGCLHEINELINAAQMNQVVFVIETAADEALLRQQVDKSWPLMRPTSPNRLSPSAKLNLFHYAGSGSRGLPQLLGALSNAASSAN